MLKGRSKGSTAFESFPRLFRRKSQRYRKNPDISFMMDRIADLYRMGDQTKYFDMVAKAD